MKYTGRINTPSPSPPIKRRRKNKIMHYNHERRPVLAPPKYFSEEYQLRQQLKKKHKHHRQQQKIKNLSRSHRHYMPRGGSLSTIPEESGSYRSASAASIGSHKETNPRNVQVSTVNF